MSVANHAVLRAPATGQIDVPELGRVEVRAHAVGGGVDVAVSADQADTRATLRGHLGAMTADLREADVPVARVSVERGDATASHGQAAQSSARDRGTHTQDSPRDQSPRDTRQDEEPTNPVLVAPRRVRIVL